ncbi:hypothetical protein CLV63_14119 [Murinocardiopsis flavida]|uniref:Uncharacterized protein n=1 Tax=Murinocardiopsis flavida TaxID=645275 RepID=A0A2P8CDK0_9ACTN|nr:hypothetical protein [Murinocardiopsis flavida]PSK83053.1 hypothetical protein CLV63_14119 [Murinocardiopsis flavida]
MRMSTQARAMDLVLTLAGTGALVPVGAALAFASPAVLLVLAAVAPVLLIAATVALAWRHTRPDPDPARRYAPRLAAGQEWRPPGRPE